MNDQSIFIVVIIMVVPFLFTLLIVYIKSMEKRKNNELMADLYQKSIENGKELPTDLFEAKNKNKSLRTGIILVFIGIGISIFLGAIANDGFTLKNMSGGIIPFFLGIGFLVVHFIWKKKGYTDEE
ncbi:DUF6249 domain-containing protein [Dysgonomonas macrotermitis]|uniref:DUF6249 domain-containing protein n=1 Tax=Dysgonomonas macrotermitis TaxID=1346286 RepID=A0A1M4ZW40_9BACT|nr:DUF6249 domain-containing protein [Dysgonomonas macrotermitis]SHF21816.1 hypothetical protein SAMN05444362_104200 [Dysgonomonas macrotermitis]